MKTNLLTFTTLCLVLFAGCSKENLNKEVQETNVIPGHNYSQLKSTGTDHGYFWQNYVSSGTSTISFPNAGTYPGNIAVS